MLDIKVVRENPDIIRKDLEKRDAQAKLMELDELIKADKDYRKELKELEEMRSRKNSAAKEINELKKQGKDISKKIHEMKKLPEEIKALEGDVEKLREKISSLIYRMPNILHHSVPKGKTEADNEIVKTFGEKPSFKFEPKSHVDIVESLGLVDTERAAKTSGARFYFLKKELVLLDFALMRFALDHLYKKGFALVEPPLMIRRKPYEGVTDLADFEDVIYKIQDEDLYLIATSEHAIGAMHMNEVLDEKELPLKYAGVSACFRKEAGSHGKDTKGIFRVHQFNKIEQFVFSKPEDSWKIHEELLQNAEEIFQALGFHYRVVSICSGEMGSVAAKKYDIEVWMPAQNTYREVVSCSNCTDYQARRLNVKYGKYGGEKEFVHTLNSTAIATSRAIVAIIENYQQKDGSIKVPKALVPYMSGIKYIGKKVKD